MLHCAAQAATKGGVQNVGLMTGTPPAPHPNAEYSSLANVPRSPKDEQ